MLWFFSFHFTLYFFIYFIEGFIHVLFKVLEHTHNSYFEIFVLWFSYFEFLPTLVELLGCGGEILHSYYWLCFYALLEASECGDDCNYQCCSLFLSSLDEYYVPWFLLSLEDYGGWYNFPGMECFWVLAMCGYWIFQVEDVPGDCQLTGRNRDGLEWGQFEKFHMRVESWICHEGMEAERDRSLKLVHYSAGDENGELEMKNMESGNWQPNLKFHMACVFPGRDCLWVMSDIWDWKWEEGCVPGSSESPGNRSREEKQTSVSGLIQAWGWGWGIGNVEQKGWWKSVTWFLGWHTQQVLCVQCLWVLAAKKKWWYEQCSWGMGAKKQERPEKVVCYKAVDKPGELELEDRREN